MYLPSEVRLSGLGHDGSTVFRSDGRAMRNHCVPPLHLLPAASVKWLMLGPCLTAPALLSCRHPEDNLRSAAESPIRSFKTVP